MGIGEILRLLEILSTGPRIMKEKRALSLWARTEWK